MHIRFKALSRKFFPSSSFVACFLVLSQILLRDSAGQIWDLLGKARAQGQAGTQIVLFPKDKTVVDMTAEELLQYYPSELRRLDFTSNQGELNAILEKIGDKVRSFFRDLSNTSSKESVFLQGPGQSGGIARNFNYLISYNPNGSDPLLQEYRTDQKNRPIDQTAIKGFFITSGYVGLNLNFHPKYQQDSRFRYVGKQTSDPHAYIMAFAQNPEPSDLHIAFLDTVTGMSSRIPVQGIVWVDPNTYQILRLRINLVRAVNHTLITEQSTDIKLGEVRFGKTQKRLWLPREVVVNTQMAGHVFRNQHRYTDYKLFNVASDFTIDKPQPQELTLPMPDK